MRFEPHIVIAQATQPIENPIHRVTATTVAASAAQPAPLAPDSGRIIAALFAVLVLILLLRWALRRLIPAALARQARGIRIVGRTAIGPKQQVLLLQVGRRMLVVGDSGQQLNTLCEINDPDEAAALLGQAQGGARAGGEEIVKAHPAPQTPWENDPALGSTRMELNGLTQRVRMLARHLSGT
jgi:flagellar protein FliO/FliZ